ncbi:MAG TPA: DegT/DnrJ/EryC1/StrS family aminotransferase [Gemmatimonadaceae bacterium]|nr:DegT/DnrJ/EryC1/StrS family aminotransferase [Gemmatimonadaceae bacterium]
MGRWVPPVHSPVSVRSLAAGATAAAGLARVARPELHARLSTLFSARDVLLTDSGTSALVLALRAVAKTGAAVAFPAFACIDLTAAAIRAGVNIRLYDVEPATMSPDLSSLRAACARGVQAIVIAPLYGYPVDFRGVSSIAREHGVPVIEDAAQSAGAELEGTRVGAFGELSVLSFGRGKGTTTGAGGAILVRDAAFAAAAAAANVQVAQRGWRPLIALTAQWLLARPSLFALPASIPALKLGEMVYHDAAEPRAISVAGAQMLSAALAADRAEIRHRRERAAQLTVAAERSDRFAPVTPITGAMPGYLRLAVLDVAGSATPAPRAGVLRAYPMTLDEHPRTTPLLLAGEAAGPGARTLRDRLFTLPTHSRASAADTRALVQWLTASIAPQPAPALAP